MQGIDLFEDFLISLLKALDFTQSKLKLFLRRINGVRSQNSYFS